MLTAADQDGGAHIDPALDERYARFAHDNTLGWVHGAPGEPGKPMEGAVRSGIRQIAHEVLRTLVPGYPPRHGFHVAPESPPMTTPTPKPQVGVLVPKVRRNEPCPCGSGKKYKKCHGRSCPDRKKSPRSRRCCGAVTDG